jgi:3-hydroxyacyl-[acyl-carrier-protein] dehydratase
MPTLALCISADHPAYAGHFPGRPITPGVLLLDAAQLAIEAASGQRVAGLAMAKFLSPSGPGDVLTLDFTLSETAARFDICCGERKIASGRFTLVAA